MIGKTISDIIERWFPKPDTAETETFRNSVAASNIFREKILAVLFLCVSAVLMVVDCLVMDGRPSNLKVLSIASVSARGSLIAFLSAFLIANRRRISKGTFRHRTWDTAFIGFSIFWAAGFSGALLAVRPGTEPYLIAVFTFAAFLFQETLLSAIVLGIGFILFVLSATAFHADPRSLLSGVVNSAISTVLAFIISRVLYAMRLRDFRKTLQIAEQKRELIRSNEHLRMLSLLDPLTNVANRRYLEMMLSSQWKTVNRSDLPMSIFMIDIDWFKSYNDAYGHLAGDDCLRRVATALDASVRKPADLVTRYGGEEFCVLLPLTQQEEAIIVGERIMQAVRDLDIAHIGSPLGRITVSIGIASCGPDYSGSFHRLIHSADTALYNAKINGRNHISLFDPNCPDEEIVPSHLSSSSPGEHLRKDEPDERMNTSA